MINNKSSELHNKGTRTMRDATMLLLLLLLLLLLCRLLRDGKEDVDHSTLEEEATIFL
jgi:hypothetical protein